MNLKDSLAMVGKDSAARAAFRALDSLQTLPPAEQVAGAAVLLWLVAARFHIPVSELMTQTERRILDSLSEAVTGMEAPGSTVRAIKQYLQEEVR
jgi:hypothetical protein